MEISGSIAEVVFRNTDNGYTVLELDCGDDFVTAVGTFPPLVPGEQLRLQGDWTENYKFGKQFVVTQAQIVDRKSVV